MKVLKNILNNEWIEVSDPTGILEKEYQHKRCSALFKRANGKVYYIDAIVFRRKNNINFVGTNVRLKNGGIILSRQYIKGFPFTPKAFVIDVIEPTEYTYIIKDEKQLKKVFNYYNLYDDWDPKKQSKIQTEIARYYRPSYKSF